MEVKTKFGLWSTVWFMSNNKVHYGDIMEIKINISATPEGTMKCVSYMIHDFTTSELVKVYESALFPSKEELLESL